MPFRGDETMDIQWEMLEQIIDVRVKDAWELHDQYHKETIPELKGVWEYQINLNFECINAILEHRLLDATAYTNEIKRSTKAAMKYRQFIIDNTPTR
jgi:hypothetical protein